MGIKDLILNKGWAGRTLSREATIERLNPIIRRHYELMHAYDALLRETDDRELAGQLARYQKTTRADIGKLAETVFSNGGVAYNGTDLEPDDVRLDADPAAALRAMRDQEQSFQDTVATELKEEHQIRTRAILSVVLQNSRDRLDYLADRTR